MPQNSRRKLITGAVAAVAAAQTVSAQTKPEKKVIRSGPKPAKTPLFSPAVQYGNLLFISGIGYHEGSDITALGATCNGTHHFGKVSFGTEASLFHNASIPTVICGPGHIAQAHQPNEWVAVEQIARCEAFMRRLADQVCAT